MKDLYYKKMFIPHLLLLSQWYLGKNIYTKKKYYLEKLKKAGIEFRLITGGSFFKHPVSKYFDYKLFNGSKNVDYVHNNGFFVGNHPKKLDKELNYLKKVLKEK